jgi:hypothetical protein
MSYWEFLSILTNSLPGEWVFNDARGIYIYRDDLHLRIFRKEVDKESSRFCGENWATKHPDPNAYRVTYEIFYGSTFLDEKILIAVDGFRAYLPIPKSGSSSVSYENYKFASIVDDQLSLDVYLERAGLVVDNL